jgi:DNA-binding transcriptional LysR family regulator
MPARHPLAARRSVKLADLEGAQLIVPPSGRPHRTLLSRMLQSAEVTWHVAVEASGWELMLQFVRLGLGLAIVNACCRMPAGVTSRPMPELPSLQYYVFHLDKALPKAVVELKKNLLDHRDAWKDSR